MLGKQPKRGPGVSFSQVRTGETFQASESLGEKDMAEGCEASNLYL